MKGPMFNCVLMVMNLQVGAQVHKCTSAHPRSSKYKSQINIIVARIKLGLLVSIEIWRSLSHQLVH